MKLRAFTLIELLVVVVIISILAALALGAISSVRRKADATQSAHNLRTLAQANAAYLAENGRYAPAANNRNTRRWHGARTSAKSAFDPAKGYLADYLGKSARVTTCPVFQKMKKARATFEEGTGGYGYNANYIGGTPLALGQPRKGYQADGTIIPASAAAVETPATTVMFTSTAYARTDGVQEYATCDPPFWDYGDGSLSARPNPTVHFRFDGKALVAWCDGHVSFESPQERPVGTNPHGGDAASQKLGWFGPDENNGFWNPQKN